MATSFQSCMSALCLVFLTRTFAMDGIDWYFDSYDKCPRAVLLEADGSISHKMPLSAFTFSFFVKMEDRLNYEATVFSYASYETGQANEVRLEISYSNSYVSLSINGEKALYEVLPKKNEWAHIAVTWNTVNGLVTYYLNGVAQSVSDGYSKIVRAGYTLAKQGCIVLGQDQDRYNEGFYAPEGLTGGLTQFNLWDRDLTADEVKKVQTCNLTGNVVKWDTALWGFSDKLMQRPTTAPCNVKCGQPRT